MSADVCSTANADWEPLLLLLKHILDKFNALSSRPCIPLAVSFPGIQDKFCPTAIAMGTNYL